MSKDHSLLGDLVGKAGVIAGIVREVPDPVTPDENTAEAASPSIPPSLPRSQPSVPGIVTTAPVTFASNSASSLGVEVQTQFEANFPAILSAAPPGFQEFLTQKRILMETLKESVPENKLEPTATRTAFRLAKLTRNDVSAAMGAMRGALINIRKEIDAVSAEQRRVRMDVPAKKIQDAKGQIDALTAQVTNLQRQIASLQASIEPQQRAIVDAESELSYIGNIANAMCDRINETLAAMENELVNLAGNGGKKQ